MSRETLDMTAELELTFVPDFQTAPIVVRGDAENIVPFAEAIQRAEPSPVVERVAKVQKVAQTASLAVTEAFQSPRAAVHAKLYDMVHRTNMYGLLMEKRAEERDLRMARRLGLVTTTHCQKHEKALAEVRGIQ